MKAGKSLEEIMEEIFQLLLKNVYSSWIEAQTYLELKGIPKKKPDQLLNKQEKYEKIAYEDWQKSGLEYKILEAKFEIKPTQQIWQQISNLYF